MDDRPAKPVEQADRRGAELARAGEAAARAWWRRVPRVLTAPRSVFAALAETDDLDVDARSEPVLAIVILAGMASILLTPAWGTVMDDGTVDGLVLVVLTFIGGLFYGAAGYFLLGLALLARGEGRRRRGAVPDRAAGRRLRGGPDRARPRSCVVPMIAFRFGWDWFRTTGSDTGAGRDVVIAIGLAFVGVVASRSSALGAAHDVPPALARRRRRARSSPV